MKNSIDEKFSKYDLNGSGDLDKQQLQNMMTDLNDGIKPSDDEVDLIMNIADTSKTGVINRWEVRRAVEEWYTYAAIANDKRKQKEEYAKKKENAGGCCTIS